MNSFDYLLVVIVGLSCGLALIRGFAREAAGILGWLAGFALAVYLAGYATRFLSSWTSGKQILPSGALSERISEAINVGIIGNLSAFLLVFVASLLTVVLVGRLVLSLVDKVGLSSVNRALGLAFGLVRGVSLILVGFFILQILPISEPIWISESQLAPICRVGVTYLTRWVPVHLPLLPDMRVYDMGFLE